MQPDACQTCHLFGVSANAAVACGDLMVALVNGYETVLTRLLDAVLQQHFHQLQCLRILESKGRAVQLSALVKPSAEGKFVTLD